MAAPQTSTCRSYLWPDSAWPTDRDPMAPFSKRNSTLARSSPSTLTGLCLLELSVEKASAETPVVYRTGIVVLRLAMTASIFAPDICSTRSHQWEPISPSAELMPPFSGSDRHEYTCGSVIQS